MIGIEEVCTRWALSDVRQIADTPGSLVYRARRADGRAVVAKLLKPTGMGEMAGMDYLAWRQGSGSVMLVERYGTACLIEYAGYRTLEDLRAEQGEAAATEIFASLLHELHAPSPLVPLMGLVPLERHFAALVDEAPPPTPAASALDVAWAADVARTLLGAQTNAMPLHGDLHHENILADEAGRWRAIDPHGLFGDPVYDVANFFGNPIGRPDITCDTGRTRLLSGMLATALGCDEVKILQYAAAHAALSACWSIGDPVSETDLRDAEDRLAFLKMVRGLLF